MESIDLKPKRAKKPSNSVTKGAVAGGPAAVISAYAAFRLATKYAVPLEIASMAVGLVVQGVTSAVSYFARGGRRGEAD